MYSFVNFQLGSFLFPGRHIVLVGFLFPTEPFLDEMLQMALDTKEVMEIMPYLPGPLALVGFSHRAGLFLDETLQTAFLLETREVV